MKTVRDIYNFINELAPFKYTDKFDNTGLLAGDFSDEVTKILLALDITNEAADEALDKDCDLIISHHPVIFHPLKSIDESNPVGRLSRYLINAICAHTNLDMAEYGVSDIMADMLGLKNNGQVIDCIHKNPYKQMVVFVPEQHAENVYAAMTAAGGGALGNYSGCAFFGSGTGCFIPTGDANPYIGIKGINEKVNEVRIEMLVKPTLVNKVKTAMLSAHPYEEPAYQILDNHAIYEEIGYGRMCSLDETVDTKTFAQSVKDAFGCSVLRYFDSGRPINKVAISSGAGGSSYQTAFEMGADAYVTGDVKHDQWIGASNIGLTLIDAGHFHTEVIVLDYLKKQLKKKFPRIKVAVAKSSKDIVSYM